MKSFVLVLAIMAALLFAFGCAGPQISAKEEPKKAIVPPVQEEEKTPPPPPPPAEEEKKNETIAPPEENLDADSCSVEFQKDPNGVYYIMAKTDSPRELFVKCPNRKLGEKRGGLYFCDSLATGEPVVAYLYGDASAAPGLKECGRAYFDRASLEKTSGSESPIGCSVSVAPSRISVGQTSVVTVWTSTGSRQVTVSYNCGSEIRSQKRGGMMSDSQICQFNMAGTIDVYAKVDGEVCASRILEVFSSLRDCSVYGSKLEMEKGEYIYTATVAGRGYSGTDEMKYKCYGISYVKAVRELPNSTDFATVIECRGNEPLAGNVYVKVADNNCGELEVADRTAAP